MSYAVMPLADYDAACDKVREKVGEQTVLFEETDFGYLRSAPFSVVAGKTYTVRLNLTDAALFQDVVVTEENWDLNQAPWKGGFTNPFVFEAASDKTYCAFFGTDNGLTANDILSATLECDGEVVADFAPPLKIKSGEMADRVEDVFEAGKEAEREAFWDKFQNYGERTDYSGDFAGQGLINSGYLPPKYPIVCGSGSWDNVGVFQFFNKDGAEQYDMTEICKLLDCSKAFRLQNFFADSNIKNVTVDMSNCEIASSMFGGDILYCDVDNVTLKVTEKLKNTGSMFSYCRSLKTIRFTEDSVINVAISWAYSPLLSAESVDSILNVAANGITLTFHSDVVGRMTEAQWAVADRKNLIIK